MRLSLFRWIFYPAVLITIILAIVLIWLNYLLINPMSPQGMINLELAKTPEAARQILNTWGAPGMRTAAINLLVDFPFLVGYTLVFLCLTWLTRTVLRPLFLIGFGLAGAADLVENLLLVQVLAGNFHPNNLQMAYWCASIKFGLLLTGWVYLLICGLWALWQRRRQRPE